MLPEEEEQETTNTMTTLMGNEKRKQTMTNIIQSARQTRAMSSARESHRASELWDEGNKRNSVNISSKKKASAAGSSAFPKALLHIGKGLSCKYMNMQEINVDYLKVISSFFKVDQFCLITRITYYL